MVLLAGVEFVLTWVNREHGVRPAKKYDASLVFFRDKTLCSSWCKNCERRAGGECMCGGGLMWSGEVVGQRVNL